MPVISARQPGTLPAIAILRRRCEALARLDRALDPDEDVPTHDFDRRAGIFWLRDSGGNHVQISFRKAGVVILGFDHDSPMSPAHNNEAIWPGVVDDLPSALRRALADYSFEHDITFCIWREARARQWRSGRVRRPRGRDVDGSARLLAILDGNPRGYRAYARTVFESVGPARQDHGLRRRARQRTEHRRSGAVAARPQHHAEDAARRHLVRRASARRRAGPDRRVRSAPRLDVQLGAFVRSFVK